MNAKLQIQKTVCLKPTGNGEIFVVIVLPYYTIMLFRKHIANVMFIFNTEKQNRLHHNQAPKHKLETIKSQHNSA